MGEEREATLSGSGLGAALDDFLQSWLSLLS